MAREGKDGREGDVKAEKRTRREWMDGKRIVKEKK